MEEQFYKINAVMLDEIDKLLMLYRNSEVKAAKEDTENAIVHDVLIEKIEGMRERIAIITEGGHGKD